MIHMAFFGRILLLPYMELYKNRSIHSKIYAMNNNRYSTLAEASTELKRRGFKANFSVNENEQLVDSEGNHFAPSDVKLIEFHRFEGISNPADSTIIYAVETNKNLKGTVVDSFGADASEVTSSFMNKVEQKQFDD